MADGAKVQTFVESSDEVGKDVPVARDTDTPDVPGDYHEYEGSEAKMYETFSERASALEKALGNKDQVRG